MTSLSALLLRRPADPEVKPGYTFRRDLGRWSENVTVLDLKDDPAGIPHVRYTVTMERRFSARAEKAFKVMALASFRDTYRERVA
jgi:hypothetical protein